VFSSLGGSFTQNAVLADCKAKKVAHSLARHVPPRAAKVGDPIGDVSGISPEGSASGYCASVCPPF
jgi:hypothetical protein